MGVGSGLGPGLRAVGWCYVCVSLDSLFRWQAQVSVYCAWRIPAHLTCTQCSILLHLKDICFLTCICLWQISQIQTRLFKVVGPGLVSTSPAFVSSSASHPAGPHGRHAQKNGKSGPHCREQKGSTCATCVCCDSSTACMLCRLELCSMYSVVMLYVNCGDDG